VTERRAGESGEADLVRAVASGSEEALAALYDRHAGGIHAVALRLTNDRQLAEEVVQETFLALWNRAELFDPALASLGTWLRTIARNRTVDRLRAAGRRPPLVPLPGSGDGDEGDPGFDRVSPTAVIIGGSAPEPGPEAAAEAAESRAAVEAAIAGMPDEERTVIVLAYREGLTQSEIAERLGWPLGTVKTRTRRALARLRAVLETEDTRPMGNGGGDMMDDHGPR
jgi:RNA polymerase sigma-70 factor (ECF subfamily)